MGHIRNNVIHSHQTPPSPNAPLPQKRCDSRTLQKPYLPNQQKTSPKSTRLCIANQIFALKGRVLLGEVLGERGRFGGREPRLSRGGSLPPRSFPPPTHQTFIGRSRVRSWIASAMCGARITSLESRSAIVRATRRMRPYPRALNPMRSYAARSRADASSST